MDSLDICESHSVRSFGSSICYFVWYFWMILQVNYKEGSLLSLCLCCFQTGLKFQFYLNDSDSL